MEKQFKIDDDVKLFAGMTKKKYKKKYASSSMSKKEIKKNYYKMLISCLPEVIKLLVFYPNVKEVTEIKDSIYEKLMEKEMIDAIEKDIEKYGIDDIENLNFLPVIIADAIKIAKEYYKEEKDSDPDAKDFDLNDLLDLSLEINKKKLKKFEKAGIPKEVAVDVLSVLPSSKLLEKNGVNRIKSVMSILYQHANTKEFKFEDVVKYAISSDYYPLLITYLLLEKKSDYVNYTDKQKEFFNKVTDWCFNTLENMDKTEINEILKSYFNIRKMDKQKNKDSNRRFFLSSLPESEFPNICKVLNKMKSINSGIEEFM